MLTFKAKARKSMEGSHHATINLASETVSKHGTPQVEVKFALPNAGSIRNWYHLQGYEHNKDGSYKLDNKGERIISDEMTDKAILILQNMACDAGIDEESDFSINDLVGKTLTVVVGIDDRGNYTVKRTEPAKEVLESQEME